MANEEYYYTGGMTQSDYLLDKVQLIGFRPVESDWKELFRWIMSVSNEINYYDDNGGNIGNVGSLWKNHVFTVLIDIMQVDLPNLQARYMQNSLCCEAGSKLEELILIWKERLNTYLNYQMVNGQDVERNLAIQIAKTIKEQLETLVNSNPEEKLKVIRNVQQNGNLYIQSIEKNGDMDSALALLLTYVRNYSSIMERFNRTFQSVPDFYRNKILMSSPRKAVQDKTSLVITPVQPSSSFTLPAKTQFVAGEKEDGSSLIYQTENEECISGMEINEIFAICPEKEDRNISFFKQKVGIKNTRSLYNPFIRNEECTDHSYGWMIGTNMFVLKEGERVISINFKLKYIEQTELIEKNEDKSDNFFVYVSDSEKWSLKETKVTYIETKSDCSLSFEIAIPEGDNSLVSCSLAQHKMTTEFPVVKILINNQKSPYSWLKKFAIDELKIDLDVKRIRNIDICNDLGSIDSSKPFSPFGVQAEREDWFRFGNEEMALKDSLLTEVVINGIWNRLPNDGFKEIYETWNTNVAKYDIRNDSFKVKFEHQNEINPADNEKHNLFCIFSGMLLEKAELKISLNNADTFVKSSSSFSNKINSKNTPESYNLFRIKLDEPFIGFGTIRYKEVFARIILENKPLPKPPVIPLWADMTLSYKASGMKCFTEREGELIQLSRITALSEYEFVPIEVSDKNFICENEDRFSLYLGIANCFQKKILRMYFDLVYIKNNPFLESFTPNNGKLPILNWSYMIKSKWIDLDSKDILVDETCGLSQRGYVEIKLPEAISDEAMDRHYLFWLRVEAKGDVNNCLPIRYIYMNCFSVIAVNGDGVSLPVGTIKQLKNENPMIKSIVQPFEGCKGKVKESGSHFSVRQSYRIANRHRIVTPIDYEQMVIEEFPFIRKVCCLPVAKGFPDINIVVFSYTENNLYPMTPTWELADIKKYLSMYLSPFVQLNVLNPLYQKIKVKCIALAKIEIIETGKGTRRITEGINNYFAAWIKKNTFPDFGRVFSYKALHSLIANDEGVVKILELLVDGKSLPDTDVDASDLYFSGNKSWSVLVPMIELKLLLSNGGIGESMIEYNFIIK